MWTTALELQLKQTRLFLTLTTRPLDKADADDRVVIMEAADDDAHDEQQVQTDEDAASFEADAPASGNGAMSAFFRASTPDHSGAAGDLMSDGDRDGDRDVDPATSALEFSLLIILQPDNVRHRVVATPEMTIAELTAAICTDLKLDADLVTFPGLNPAVGLSLADTPLAAYGFNGSTASGDERVLQAFVARKTNSSEYVMPDRIQVQVYDGTSGCDCSRSPRSKSVRVRS